MVTHRKIFSESRRKKQNLLQDSQNINTVYQNASNRNKTNIFAECIQIDSPSIFKLFDWRIGDSYSVRIANIYDPSKFWLVIKHRELDLFQTYLHKFYTEHLENYRIPSNKLKLDLYCVVYTNKTFYRGKIIDFQITSSITKKAQLYLIDFGYVCGVPINDVFYLSEKMYSVPQFAIRASLAINLSKKDQKTFWDEAIVKQFQELTTEKILLAKLVHVDLKLSCLYIKLGLFNDETQHIIDLSSVLIKEQKHVYILRRKQAKEKGKSKRKVKFIPKVKHLRDMPPFELIENGCVPPSYKISQLLLQSSLFDFVYKNYYVFNS